jgi:hypothetical protein
VLHLPAGERADHEFGHAHGQRPHGGGADGGTGRTAQTQHAGQLPAFVQVGRDLCHPGRREFDRLAAVAGRLYVFPIRADRREYRGARNVRLERGRTQDASVRDEYGSAGPAQPIADVSELCALGVQRADE